MRHIYLTVSFMLSCNNFEKSNNLDTRINNSGGSGGSGSIAGAGGAPQNSSGGGGTSAPGGPTAVALGSSFICVHRQDTIHCWGANSDGQLGVGDYLSRLIAESVTPEIGEVSVETLTLGADYACVLTSEKKLKCWGNNEYGQLGLGDTNNRGDQPGEMGANLPFTNIGNEPIKSVSSREAHACIITQSNKVKCWGWNYQGQLGLGDEENRGDIPKGLGDKLPFVDLGTDDEIDTITTGPNRTCAIFSTGGIKCWGSNFFGELGQGDKKSKGLEKNQMGINLPYTDLGKEKFKQISMGAAHNCALSESGKVKCWGDGSTGVFSLGIDGGDTLGDEPGEMGEHLPYLQFGTDEPIKQLASGAMHTCALFISGKIKCWGANLFGQLGLGDNISRGNTPETKIEYLPYVDVGSESEVIDIRSHSYTTCAVFKNNKIKCWGVVPSEKKSPFGDSPGEMGDNLPFIF